MEEKRIALVTGGVKGIGKAIADALTKEGYTVVATTRSPKNEGEAKLDITDPASCKECIDNIIKAHGRIDLLVNCAGMGYGGAMEDLSDDELTREVNTNLLGTARMMHAVLPHMRGQGSGRIINIGSVAGRIEIPFQAMYSASKAGMALMTDAVRLELKGTGVQVCVVEPGDTRTDFTAARAYASGIKKNEAYRRYCENALNTMMYDEQHGKAPESVAKVVVRQAKRRRMRARVVVGFDYKLLSVLAAIVPKGLLQFILYLMYMRKGKDGGFSYDAVRGNAEK